MTLEQATKTIESIKIVCRTLFPPKEQEALSLGIEALKTIKAERTIYGFKRQVRLPGETEEPT
jgi:hypothetical protein